MKILAPEVLGFWFGGDAEYGAVHKRWFEKDPAFDAEVRTRFSHLHEALSANRAWLDAPRECLARIVVLDQFPRNMFRGHAEQFATDHLALAIARAAVDRGLDDQLEPHERGFFYMPFQHSEDLADQRRSLAVFTALGDDYLLGYAKKHHAIIERFGRFPHRNAILGRAPRADEVAAGKVVPW